MKVSDADEYEVVKMYVEGKMGAPTISTEMGINLLTVYAILRRNGVPIRQAGERFMGPAISWEDIGADYQGDPTNGRAGMLMAELKVKYGVGEGVIYKVLKSLGIPLRSTTASEERQPKLDAAVELYKRGVKTRVILVETGVYPNELYLEMTKLGLKLRRNRRAGKTVPGEIGG